MRFGFVTCVQLGLACMEEIYAAGGRLDLVLTLLDDKARKKTGRIYPDDFCNRHGIPLVKIGHINDAEARAAIRAQQLDWLFIIGWSQIAGEDVLRVPRRGALGMHPTLLPEGRGRAAIPWAILKKLPRTGVTLFRLEPGVDTGPIAAQVEIPIAPDETATSLYQRVSEAHQTLLREAWPGLTGNTVRFTPQDESLATYWPGRTPEDGWILPTMTVGEVDRLVRATTRPYPGAYIEEGGVATRIWRGRIAGGEPALPGAMRLVLADGAYDALEWERGS
jgi:methionyl-tRNA formyltransferase